MALVGLMSALQRTWLLRHPELGSAYRDQVLHGLAADLAMVLLFGVALLIALTVPGVSYFPMFLMFLVGPAERLIRRALPGKAEHRP
ncbi:hypothetical protein G7070_07340 [Propioniciclava coleopterorum]|uniref:Uncharacterized protein n=1 Tax=Propioniciclava coleopterorum TaxID=2714937 RepID=A0A6G7Y5X7_9ACTN|nr:hypothetical protein [Propioniciclava coleopterorum]QIK72119.1 hypothetical protein G7070_07340 [Propioniciclava coleopterorum]